MEWMTEGLSRGSQAISPEARVSFWLAFGITPDMQEAMEAHYRGLPLQSGDRRVCENDIFTTVPIPTYHLPK
jgi:hypothetical protein